MYELSDFSRYLADTIKSLHSSRFPQQLVAMLRCIVQIDDVTVIAYSDRSVPEIEYFEATDDINGTTLDTFVQGTFLLDPYYLAGASEYRYGVFCLRDLTPPGFREGEYFKNWYRNCGYQDECGFVIPVSPAGFINIALGKTAPFASFSRRENALLEEVYPIVQSLVKEHWAPRLKATRGSNFRMLIHHALNSFGATQLTERESQVIHLVLQGYCTKAIGKKLAISFETVKLHRKHSYTKLGVSSQGELFILFLNSVMNSKEFIGAVH